jgi:5-methylcytosine-specific restriction endonuclease McrA
VRKRDGYRCRECGKTQAKNGQRLAVDHVAPRRGLTDQTDVRDEELMSRCATCHGRKTAGAERALARGNVLEFRRRYGTSPGQRT